jgi:hypothetical protein
VADPEVSEGLGEVSNEVIFDGSLDNYVVDISLDIFVDLRP